MQKAYLVLGAIVILGAIGAFFVFRNFSPSLSSPDTSTPSESLELPPGQTPEFIADPDPGSPTTPSTSSAGLTFTSPSPLPSLAPEVQAYYDFLAKDTASLTCSQNSDCQWYGKKIYSETDQLTYVEETCQNSHILESCPDCYLGDPATNTPNDQCACIANRCE